MRPTSCSPKADVALSVGEESLLQAYVTLWACQNHLLYSARRRHDAHGHHVTPHVYEQHHPAYVYPCWQGADRKITLPGDHQLPLHLPTVLRTFSFVLNMQKVSLPPQLHRTDLLQCQLLPPEAKVTQGPLHLGIFNSLNRIGDGKFSL